MSRMILPGGKIGCLGGGQLASMLGREARRMGYSFHVYSPDPKAPAARFADSFTVAAFDDFQALARFADQADVVTLEFENVPGSAAASLADRVLLNPGLNLLQVAQHRLKEKEFLSRYGFPVAAHAPAHSPEELESALAEVGLPAVVKTVSDGYDGLGQWRLNSAREREGARIDRFPVVVEELLDLSCEISVIAARNSRGEYASYAPFLNAHRNHILDVTISPAGIPDSIARQATEVTEGIADQLDLVGLFCVEFFVTSNGSLLVNELAPRPHNSGHLTLEAHQTSQFEQQVRAICGLPLGSTEQRTPAAMANLLGDLWEESAPLFDRALEVPGVRLHLYGKAEARPGRKMGHLTALGRTAAEAAERVTRAREQLLSRRDSKDSMLLAG